MIKAILFDCFGVLSSEGWQNFKVKYFENDPEALQEALRIRTLADRGHYSHDEVMQLFAELAGISTEQVKEAIENYHPNDQLLNYIKSKLVGTYKIGMLSNVSDDWLFSIFTESQLSIFDTKTLSYKMGFAKPDPRAYEVAVKELGLQFEECLFIDDIDQNAIAARQLGMHAIQYENFHQTVNDLEAILATNSDK